MAPEHKQTEEWAKDELKTLLSKLLEDISYGKVTLKNYNHNLQMVNPSTREWLLEFTQGNISIKLTTP